MEVFLTYLKVFAVGGALCALGQLLINKTEMSSARILVTFMLLGLVLEAAGVFGYMKDFAAAGVTVPITGFGSSLAKGAIKGDKNSRSQPSPFGVSWLPADKNYFLSFPSSSSFLCRGSFLASMMTL